MQIDQAMLKRMFLSAAECLHEKSGYFSEIDSKFGDGDHGVTIGKIADTIEKQVSVWEAESIHDFIETLCDKIMGVNGGSAGPLYGTMIGGMAEPLTDEKEVDASLLKKMLQGMLSEMQDLTTAKVGDKTMMDALIPAVEAGISAPEDIKSILTAAAKGAEEGAKRSETFVAKFGRARSYKEQTIGTPDAGAISTAVFFNGLAKGV